MLHLGLLGLHQVRHRLHPEAQHREPRRRLVRHPQVRDREPRERDNRWGLRLALHPVHHQGLLQEEGHRVPRRRHVRPHRARHPGLHPAHLVRALLRPDRDQRLPC